MPPKIQHICRIPLAKDKIDLIRRAMSTPGAIDAVNDTMLGKTSTWDGRTVDVRLCGRPGQTALLAVAVFGPGMTLQTYRNSQAYTTGFEFIHDGVEFVVSIVPE